ncbi:MAG: collagen-like protein [Christensenellales bacterium]
MFDARKGQITITRGDTGLLAIVPTGYVPTSQDRMFFMVAEMPDGRIVINKTVTPDDDGVCKLTFSGTDTENLSKRHREYTYAIRFALDVTESNGKITGYREMITPEPPGCFVVLEANGCPACTCETQNAGSMEVKLESFRGPQGPKGEKGDKGDTGAKGEPGKDAVIDATLTREGAAADAAATGKRLEEIEKAVAEKADKARQNILIGSETGNPVSVSDAFSAPLCGLTVYGRSTQDGTPSPDNPVPIVSAGDGGSVAVTLSDGNGKTQTLTLPTPNGLPGIPVTSGGNYTDPTGRQWVCDEVDLERGVRVQRVDKGAFDSTKALAEQNAILATPVEAPLTPDELIAYKALTTYAPNTVVQASDGAGVKLDYQKDVNIAIKNLEDAIASMTTT